MAIGFAIDGIGDGFETVAGDEPRSDEELDLPFPRFVISAHHTGKAVAVGNADGREAEIIGGGDELLRMRCAAQEGEIGGDGELGIG
jgi:hypothetical protein